MKTGLLVVLAALALVTTGFSGGWHGDGGGWHGGGGWRGGGWSGGGWRGAATTAVAASTPQGIIDGTAAGAGGEAVGTRGGFFRCLSLIRITEGTTVQAMDTAGDMVTVTGTDTDMDDPQTVTITITKRSELLGI
jgi:hypothetical protein